VPDCRVGSPYHIDLLAVRFRACARRLAVENSRKINGRILKMALSALNARPGLLLVPVTAEIEVPLLNATRIIAAATSLAVHKKDSRDLQLPFSSGY